MPTSLTNTRPKDTYQQLLHVDGGVSATETFVRGGTGTASILKLGTTSMSAGNIRLTTNTISSIDTNGDINITPNGSGSVVITNLEITSGVITGITDLAVADGGTGASNATDARTNLGLGSIATQGASSVAITGGSVRVTTDIGFSSTAGTGGSVTQATDKSTGVTLDKPCGQVVTHAANLAATTAVSFTLTNSSIAATDVVQVCIASGATANAYIVSVTAVATGSCRIQLYNATGGGLAEALTLNFIVLKAINA